MQEDLKSLLSLQEKDRQVMAIEEELDALNPELARLDAEVEEMEGRLASAERLVAEITQKRESLEGKIESYRVMQERRRQKLEWVRGAKEASTLMAEIDLARTVLVKEEAEWLRSADEVQRAEDAADAARARVEEVKGGQAERRDEIREIQAGCHGRLEAARAEREACAKGVRQEALAEYERIRRGRAALALYPLHGGACGHCYTAVPLHLRQQLEEGEGAEPCEACGVMMYRAHE